MSAEQIAAGLTHSDRRWLIDCPPDGARWGVYVADKLAKRGICNPTGWPIKLTPLGLAIRRILQETPDA